MRILLTGATGFIGARLLPLLKDHDVLCLTRDARRLPMMPWATPLEADMARPESFRRELEKFAPQWCFHLAWEGLPDYSPARCLANVESSVALFRMLGEIGVARVIAAGTCWEYGAASGAVAEADNVTGLGEFALAKDRLRGSLVDLSASFGFDYRWARVFFAYGPGQRRESLIPLCHAAYSQGLEPAIRSPGLVQDFVHVDDAAQGLLALAQNDMDSGIYNIGSGEPCTVGDVANRVAAHFGRSAPFDAIAPQGGFWADMSKTTQATGWKPTVSLADGVSRSLAALDRAS